MILELREGVTPTSNRQPQSQDPTPQRDHTVTSCGGPEPKDGRGGGGGGAGLGRTEEGAKKRKKPHKSYSVDAIWKTERDWGGRREEKRYKRMLV